MLANITTGNWIAIWAIIVPAVLTILGIFISRSRKKDKSNNCSSQIIVQNHGVDATKIINDILDRYAINQKANGKIQSRIDQIETQLDMILKYVAGRDKGIISNLSETGDIDMINRILSEDRNLSKKSSIVNGLGDFIRKSKSQRVCIPKNDEADKLVCYKIFIASPGGLEKERAIVRKGIDYQNNTLIRECGIEFKGRGWEDVSPRYGTAQSLINEELYKCKYFILILWDKWGSPPYPGNKNITSGSEAEYLEAVRLIEDDEINDIAVFFKTDIDPTRLKKPDKQLRKVLEFKQKIIEVKKPFFKEFTKADKLQGELSVLLAEWTRELAKHKKPNIFGSDKFKPNDAS